MKDSNRKRIDKKRPATGSVRKLSANGNPPDSEIDTSDIPRLTEDFFRNAVRNSKLRKA
jgi:hypothetical protein